jgi:hypothetical protein
MASSRPALTSTSLAREQVLSNGLWEVIVFLINGVLFALLGMQLPQAMSPTLSSDFGLPQLIGIVCAMTALVIGVRFIWVAFLELAHHDPESGKRGTAHIASTLREALITTIAGPKGAVTLSIILTLPFTMGDGSPFPERNLIIFLTSGTILLTLIVANFALPLIAGEDDAASEEELRRALIIVLQATLRRIREVLKDDEHAEYVPALRLVAARYRNRLFRERLQMEGSGEIMAELADEVFKRQQARADELQRADRAANRTVRQAAPYYSMLRGIRQSIGYSGGAAKVGSRFHNLRGMIVLLWHETFRSQVEEGQRFEATYYDTCLFAIELERVAIDYLEGVVSEHDGQRSKTAQVLVNEHRSASESLWGRINYGQDVEQDPGRTLVHKTHEDLPEGMNQTFGEQFRAARKHADEADARALEIELEEIGRLRAAGEITRQQAHKLRESVYLMQMTLGT